jgi:multimeric flavodoxin WrbA
MPKALFVNSSPHKNGNTAAMLSEISGVLKSSGIDIETVDIGGTLFRGCNACGMCKKNKNGRCIIDDALSGAIERALKADVLVIGSPTYFADITPEAKAFGDRCGYVARANDFALERKIGAAAVPARRAGAIHAVDSINHFFLVNKMIVAGSSYWPLSLARDIGEYEKDEEGVQTMKDLGAAIAWLLEKTT